MLFQVSDRAGTHMGEQPANFRCAVLDKKEFIKLLKGLYNKFNLFPAPLGVLFTSDAEC